MEIGMHGPAAGRASNEEITELALDSAIALDKRLQQEPIDSKVVNRFLDVLEGIVNVSPQFDARRMVSEYQAKLYQNPTVVPAPIPTVVHVRA